MPTIPITFGTKGAISGASGNYGGSCRKACKIADNKVAVVWNESRDVKTRIGTISGTTVTWGDALTLYTHASSSPGDYGCIIPINTDKYIVVYGTPSMADIYAVTCSVATRTITKGTAKKISGAGGGGSGNGGNKAIAGCKLDTNKFVVAYAPLASDNRLYHIVGEDDSGTISLGSLSSQGGFYSGEIGVTQMDTDKFITGYTDRSNSIRKVLCSTVSGTTITLGTEVDVVSNGYFSIDVEKYDTNKFIVIVGNTSNRAYIRTGGISGTTITMDNNEVQFNSVNSRSEYVFIERIDTNKVVVGIKQTDDGTAKGQIKAVEISGTTITQGDIDKDQVSGSFWSQDACAVTGSKLFYVFPDPANSNYFYGVVGDVDDWDITSPTVTTQDADTIAATSVRGNGNITATGGENCTRRGFCYKVGTSGDPTTSDSVAYDDGDFGTGAFTKSITGLSPNTSYRVRAYAVNSAGTSYGSTVDVKTLSASNFFLFFN